MRVPDDVTLLWCDDNWGNIRRLPTPTSAARPGGVRRLLPLRLRRRPAQLQVAQHQPDRARSGSRCTSPTSYGADRLWIVNVGDIKPMEFPIAVLPRLRVEPGRAGRLERLPEYPRAVGGARVRRRARGRDRRARRRATRSSTAGASPSCSTPSTYSLVELPRGRARRRRYDALARRAPRRVHAALPAEHARRVLPARAASDPGVRQPARALRRPSARNRLYAAQGRAATNELADRARDAVRARTRRLTREYNEDARAAASGTT